MTFELYEMQSMVQISSALFFIRPNTAVWIVIRNYLQLGRDILVFSCHKLEVIFQYYDIK